MLYNTQLVPIKSCKIAIGHISSWSMHKHHKEKYTSKKNTEKTW